MSDEDPQTTERIEVQIEGLPQDGGAVRLSTLNNFLLDIRRALAAVEREETGTERATLAYKITALSYGSPVRCVMEPISKNASLDLRNSVVTRFNREINDVTGGSMPLGADPYTLEQFEKLAAYQQRSASISVGLENRASALPDDFDAKLRKLLSNIFRSVTAIKGKLEAVNIHASPCVVYLYPIVGPQRLRCLFPKARFPRIGEYLGKSVEISGIAKFRGDEAHPYEMEIEEITLLTRSGTTSIAEKLSGSMPDITEGMDISTYLRELRNG